jgi:hypothetical protein
MWLVWSSDTSVPCIVVLRSKVKLWVFRSPNFDDLQMGFDANRRVIHCTLSRSSMASVLKLSRKPMELMTQISFTKVFSLFCGLSTSRSCSRLLAQSSIQAPWLFMICYWKMYQRNTEQLLWFMHCSHNNFNNCDFIWQETTSVFRRVLLPRILPLL